MKGKFVAVLLLYCFTSVVLAGEPVSSSKGVHLDDEGKGGFSATKDNAVRKRTRKEKSRGESLIEASSDSKVGSQLNVPDSKAPELPRPDANKLESELPKEVYESKPESNNDLLVQDKPQSSADSSTDKLERNSDLLNENKKTSKPRPENKNGSKPAGKPSSSGSVLDKYGDPCLIDESLPGCAEKIK